MKVFKRKRVWTLYTVKVHYQLMLKVGVIILRVKLKILAKHLNSPILSCFCKSIPYLSFNVYDKELFDSIIYPDGFEKYNFKSAIPARNRYMVDNSGYAICFVTHSWGGAAKTYERAKKKKLKIINLGVKEDGERKSDIQ